MRWEQPANTPASRNDPARSNASNMFMISSRDLTLLLQLDGFASNEQPSGSSTHPGGPRTEADINAGKPAGRQREELQTTSGHPHDRHRARSHSRRQGLPLADRRSGHPRTQLRHLVNRPATSWRWLAWRHGGGEVVGDCRHWERATPGWRIRQSHRAPVLGSGRRRVSRLPLRYNNLPFRELDPIARDIGVVLNRDDEIDPPGVELTEPGSDLEGGPTCVGFHGGELRSVL